VPILHNRRTGGDRRRRDQGGYNGFDRRVRGDQRKRRSRLDVLSDAEWLRYLEMPNLLDLPVTVRDDPQGYFGLLKQRESK
jgi:hypothetical protein